MKSGAKRVRGVLALVDLVGLALVRRRKESRWLELGRKEEEEEEEERRREHGRALLSTRVRRH